MGIFAGFFCDSKFNILEFLAVDAKQAAYKWMSVTFKPLPKKITGSASNDYFMVSQSVDYFLN